MRSLFSAKRVRLAGLAALGVSGLLCLTPVQAQSRRFRFAITRAPLSQALRTFGQVCGKDVIFTEAVLAGAPPVSLLGSYTAQGALKRLLMGTKLIVERSPSGALMIRRRTSVAAEVGAPAAMRAARPLENAPVGALTAGGVPAAYPPAPTAAVDRPREVAEIVVTGSRIASRSDTSDSPLVTIGRSLLGASGQVSLDAALGQMPQFSAAQGQTEVGDVQGATGFQGGQSFSDLRGLGANRTLVLLDGRRLVPTDPNGAVDLNLIPAAMIKGVDVITGGASAVYGSDAMAGVVNFRLRHHFSGAEIEAQRGASMRGDGEETRLSVLLGGEFAHGRGDAVVDLEYAERASVTGAERAFFASIPRKVPRPPEGYFNGPDIGGYPSIAALNAVLAQYPNTTPVSGAGLYTGAIGVNADGTIFTANDAPNCVQNYRGPLAPKTPGLAISADCTQIDANLGPYFAIQVPMRRYNLYARSTWRINRGVRAYGQINFMHSASQDLQGGAFIGPGKYFYIPLNNPYVEGNAALQTILASRTNPGDPSALAAPLALSAYLTEFGPRLEHFNYNDYQALGGLKGRIGRSSLRWDVYASFGQTLFDNTEQNNINIPAVESILYGTANYSDPNGLGCIGYAWNPLGGQPLSPGCLQYTRSTARNSNQMTQKLIEGTLSGGLLKIPEGKLRFALGADYRGNSFRYRPDPGLNPAFNVLPAPLPADIISPSYDLVSATSGSQNVREVYAELLVPILKHAVLAKNVALDLGARHSNYDLFGGTNTWKADFRWQTSAAFTLRGGFERAIRAPSLGELYDTTRQAQDNISVDPCEFGSSYRSGANAAQVQALCEAMGVPAALYPGFTYGVQSVPGISSGNPHLRPETAHTYSLGFVLTPRFQRPVLREFSASLDYYHIKIDGAIALTTLDQMLASCFNAGGANPGYSAGNFYCRQFTRNPTNGDISLGREVLSNLAAYSTDGIDTQIHWGAPLYEFGLSPRAGRVRIQSYISYLHSLNVAELAGGPNVNFAGSLVQTSATPDLAHPRWKANTSFGYALDSVWAALHWRYIGAMADYVPTEGPSAPGPSVPAYNYFDLDVHWQLIRHVQIMGGMSNLFDQPPPVVEGAPLYTDAATYDPIGRTYYLGFKAVAR
ncbi:MAG: TonB-dependent receptor [Steroidobacteraceae bacterium]|nr:TonB-dependent receptor [Steroidobacteraceae bacterium]